MRGKVAPADFQSILTIFHGSRRVWPCRVLPRAPRYVPSELPGKTEARRALRNSFGGDEISRKAPSVPAFPADQERCRYPRLIRCRVGRRVSPIRFPDFPKGNQASRLSPPGARSRPGTRQHFPAQPPKTRHRTNSDQLPSYPHILAATTFADVRTSRCPLIPYFPIITRLFQCTFPEAHSASC